MAKLKCVSCGTFYCGEVLQKIPKNSSGGDPSLGICADCLDMTFEFSRKSYGADQEAKIKKVKNLLRKKYLANPEDKSVNIPSKETIVTFKDKEIEIHSKGDHEHKTKIDYFGNVTKGKSNPEIVDAIQGCLLSNAEHFIKKVCKKLNE